VAVAPEGEAGVLADDDRVGLGDRTPAVGGEGERGCGDDKLGAEVGGAHARGGVHEVAGRSLEPGDLDPGIGVEQVAQPVPLAEVAVDPPRHEVGDVLAVLRGHAGGHLRVFCHEPSVRRPRRSVQMIDTID
jgi:hypothetical protein